MKNRELAEKIYNHLNEKGAGLGNISIILIESVLNKELLQHDVSNNKVAVCDCHKGKFVFNEVQQILICGCGRRIKITN